MIRIALTFDDGYLEHFNTARLLWRLGIKGTFFVITGLEKWRGKKLLTVEPERIKEMHEMGHEIGSHTSSHPNLLLTTETEVEDELSKSKSYLEGVIASRVVGFAYPWGLHNEAVKNAVRKYYDYARVDSGFTCGMGHDDGLGDRYAIQAESLLRRSAASLLAKALGRKDRASVILFHAVDDISLVAWIHYLRLLNGRFMPLSQLIETPC
jgi:peptidoglycan/xylan/chitin deacetylase (PgdA/CDA1 family)